ncbi:MAG TPA: hypothetical protein V6D33_10900 [Cyanophyceae cyanobacterium]
MKTPKPNFCNGSFQDVNPSLPIVFINSEDDELQSVVHQVLPGAQVVSLEANQDWGKQITEALAERHGEALASDQPLEPLSVKIIVKRLFHLAQAVIKSYSHQLMTYWVERYKQWKLLKTNTSDIEKMPPVLNQSGFEEA